MKRSIIPAALVALVAAAVTPFVIWWSDLPNPMAIHWGPTGEPDGSMPPLVAVVFLAGLLIAIGLAVWRASHIAPGEAASYGAVLAAVGVVIVGATWLSVAANRGIDSWVDADEVTLVQVVGLIVAALVVAALVWLAAGGRRSLSVIEPGTAPTLDLGDVTHSVWSGRGIGKVTTMIGVVILLIALLTWGWAGIVLLVVALVALLFAEVRTTVSQRGVVVSLGWWGFPSWTVPLETVEAATVENVKPLAWGGWGYRVRPGARAVVIRAGDGLRLVRPGGHDLVYTVDDAETGAGLINSIIQRRVDR